MFTIKVDHIKFAVYYGTLETFIKFLKVEITLTVHPEPKRPFQTLSEWSFLMGIHQWVRCAL